MYRKYAPPRVQTESNEEKRWRKQNRLQYLVPAVEGEGAHPVLRCKIATSRHKRGKQRAAQSSDFIRFLILQLFTAILIPKLNYGKLCFTNYALLRTLFGRDGQARPGRGWTEINKTRPGHRHFRWLTAGRYQRLAIWPVQIPALNESSEFKFMMKMPTLPQSVVELFTIRAFEIGIKKWNFYLQC